MIPYQEAAEQIKKQRSTPIKMGMKAGSLAIGAGGSVVGSKLIGRVLPFLSSFIPEKEAIKGLGKIDPRIKSFINTALENGKPFEEVRSFLTDKVDQEIPETTPKDDSNILEQYDPYLFGYIKDMIGIGNTPKEAAEKSKKFLDDKKKKTIARIEKDHKMNFADIVESIFGKEAVVKEGLKKMQQPETQQQLGSQEQSIDPGLAQILEQGSQLLQRYKGSNG